MMKTIVETDRKTLAYVIGIAMGDGNLSNPNGRAPRLRITCDSRYPWLVQKICKAIQTLLPENKISLMNRSANCVEVSSYSKQWERWLGWKCGKGSKFQQNVIVPLWIMEDREFIISCLRGLIETDGAVYIDRGYKMINFVTTIPPLADNVMEMLASLGFHAHLYKFSRQPKMKYTVRISKNVIALIKTLELEKESSVYYGERN